MLSSNHSNSDSLQAKLDDLLTLWSILEDEIGQRGNNLDMAHEVIFSKYISLCLLLVFNCADNALV